MALVIFTDGSFNNTTTAAGCGLASYSCAKGKWECEAISMGLMPDSKHAEKAGIWYALKYALAFAPGRYQRITIYCDSGFVTGDLEWHYNGRASLQWLADHIDREVPQPLDWLEDRHDISVSIRLVPAHAGVTGNELADRMARMAREASEESGGSHDLEEFLHYEENEGS